MGLRCPLLRHHPVMDECSVLAGQGVDDIVSSEFTHRREGRKIDIKVLRSASHKTNYKPKRRWPREDDPQP